jgi:hypothetical protein
MVNRITHVRFSRWLALGVLLMPLAVASSEEKKENKDKPRVVVCTPLGILPGAAIKLKVCGVRIDEATEIRVLEPKSSAKILAKGKDNVPNGQDINRIGDSHLEIEITLPPDTPSGSVPFLVVTAAGESNAYRLLVERDIAPIAEKEPNNGFRDAQPVQLPATIEGAISQPQDVDVFRFQGEEGQCVVCEVVAARYGSPLDSILTLYDSGGHVLTMNDD